MKIPTLQERPTPQAGGFNSVPVVVADSNAVPQATAQLGNALAKVGEAAIQIKDRKDKFSYSMAYSKFLQKSIDYQNNLEQDPDFVNAPQKYKEGLATIKEDSLKELGNNGYSENLKQKMNLYEAQNYGKVLDNTVHKQTAFNIAAADQQTENNLEAFSRTKDPSARMGLLASSVSAFSNAIPETDPNKAIKVQQFTENLEKRGAQLDLMQRPLGDQIQLIKQENAKPGSNITKLLTPDDRQEWLLKAQTAYKSQQKEAQAEYERSQRVSKVKAEDTLFNEVMAGKSFDQIDPKVLYNASAESLKRAELIRDRQLGLHQVDPTKDEVNYQNYNEMWLHEPEKFANLDINEVVANVPLNKMQDMTDKLTKARNNILAPANLKQQDDVANTTLRSIGINSQSKTGKTQAALFKKRYNEEADAFKQNSGKDPTKADLQKIASSLVAGVSTESFWSGRDNKKLYQISEEDMDDIIVPDNFSNSLITQSRQAGYPPLTQDQIRTAYMNKLHNER